MALIPLFISDQFGALVNPPDPPPYMRDKDYVYLAGYIASAPLDLPGRLDQMVARLRQMGYQPVIRSVGTDFLWPGGIPVPRAQPVQLWLWRKPEDGPLSAIRARADFTRVMGEMALNYNPLMAYSNEIKEEIVVPTLQRGKSLLPWILAGVGAVFVLNLMRRK